LGLTYIATAEQTRRFSEADDASASRKRELMSPAIGKLIRRAAIPALIVLAVAFYYLRPASTAVHYVSAPVSRGPIVRSVIATGTVNPVTTVQVGSYVSGPIQAIYADFNSSVKKGDLIAKIDPRPFEVKVAESNAAVANSRAQLDKDKADAAYKKLSFERYVRL